MKTVIAIAIIAVTSGLAAAQGGGVKIGGDWTRRIPPFRVIDNIYYVGSADLSSFLITTQAGHFLIDTGVAQNADAVIEGIKTLGFKPQDVKLLLTTQAHFDHVAAHARVKEVTGAQVVASAGDAPLLEDGGKSDYLLGPDYGFTPVKVDRIVKDGEKLTLGKTTLTAVLTPGHTQGTTTWTMDAVDRGGRIRAVTFLGSTAMNPGTRLVGNEKYPQIAEDFMRTFQKQKALECEVFLAAHMGAFGGTDKAAAAKAGKGDEAFIDPAGCQAAIERSERAFNAELQKQKKAG